MQENNMSYSNPAHEANIMGRHYIRMKSLMNTMLKASNTCIFHLFICSTALFIPFPAMNMAVQEDRIIYFFIRRGFVMTPCRKYFAAKLKYH